MATGIAKLDDRADPRLRRVERSIVMHGTSRVREEGARLLAEIVSVTGAQGAAYGWTDALCPTRLVPVHAVSRATGVRWQTDLPDTAAPQLDSRGSFTWRLMIRDADRARLAGSSALISKALGWYADAELRDCPKVHSDVRTGPCPRFVALLDAYRHIGFDAQAAELPSIAAELSAALEELPPPARDTGVAVVEALGDHDRLGAELIALGKALDGAGALAEAASVHTIAYELAVQRCDGFGGIEAARMAGRAHRRMTEWSESFGWYRLARRIAEVEGATDRVALAIDGEGHTHRARGAFPAARACYEEAWALATELGDRSILAAVGHSMMTVEREARRLESAARYGWIALESQDDPRQRANLLLNIGTLIRETGDVHCAAEAFSLVRDTATDTEARMMAADALAYCAALRRGPEYGYWRRIANLESRGAPSYLRAQVGYFRGASLQALDDHDRARRVLRAVERYAARAGLHEWQMKAAELAERPLPQPGLSEAPAELREGLKGLREATAV